MDNYIIKGAGTIDEICTALKTMQAVFGKGAKISEVAKATRATQLSTAIANQLEEIERSIEK